MDGFQIEPKTIEFGDSEINKLMKTFNNIVDDNYKDEDLREDES